MKTFQKAWHGIRCVLILIVFFLSYPLAFIFFGKRKLWLISEVDFDARDNGYHFFKYLRKNHKEINVYYLIGKKNHNYEIVKKLGKTLEPFSYKHMLIFIAAKMKISTMIHGCSPSYYITKYFLIKHHGTGKNVALKHGIFKNLHPNYFNYNAHLDLICCGAKPEYEFINKNFGYKNGVALYTGLARFDALHNLEAKKEIFIMPTWRRWLDGISNDEEFKKSDYFINWNKLLESETFIKLARDNNLKIYFYVHPKLNRFIRSFSNLDKNIILLNSKNGDDIQKNLKDSSILITDFSSVFFDFAYMKKPAIYYQFDEEKYYSSHYIKAYFDYRDNAFGPVCTNYNEVIDSLMDICRNNLKIKTKYLSRSNDFFPLYDNKNCERIYNAIMGLMVNE